MVVTASLKWLELNPCHVLKEVGVDWNVFYNVRLFGFIQLRVLSYLELMIFYIYLLLLWLEIGVGWLYLLSLVAYTSWICGSVELLKLYIYIDDYDDLQSKNHLKKGIFFFSSY